MKRTAKKDTTVDADARRAALEMLSEGIVTPAEASRLAGVSRQAVDYWINRANIDPAHAREAWLAKEWRKRTR